MFIRWIISIVLNALALITVAYLFDGIHMEDFTTALLAGLILSILNVLVKPLLVILTLPITVITFGLFLLVINAAVLMLTQHFLRPEFAIDSFGIAILASALISIITMVLGRAVKGPA